MYVNSIERIIGKLWLNLISMLLNLFSVPQEEEAFSSGFVFLSIQYINNVEMGYSGMTPRKGECDIVL